MEGMPLSCSSNDFLSVMSWMVATSPSTPGSSIRLVSVRLAERQLPSLVLKPDLVLLEDLGVCSNCLEMSWYSALSLGWISVANVLADQFIEPHSPRRFRRRDFGISGVLRSK